MRHADGQSFCAICGMSHASPYHSRVFSIDGERVRVTYPSLIEYHDIVPRSQGGDPLDIDNQVPLCVECHHRHHSVSKLDLTSARYDADTLPGSRR